MMYSAAPLQFVADGCSRAQAAVEPEIRAQVIAEFSEPYEQAGFWQRLWLWRKIAREIDLRVSAIAPPDAYY